MKVRKKIAGVLAGVMLLTSPNVLAKQQNPIPDGTLKIAAIGNKVNNSSTDSVSPTVQIKYEIPPKNTISNSMGDNHIDTDSSDEADGYKIQLETSGNNQVEEIDVKPTDKNVTTQGKELYVQLDGYQDLKTGMLYKMKVFPYHDAYIILNQNQSESLEILSKSSPHTYFATDFDIKSVKEDGVIKFQWEYIEGAQYAFYMVPGNYTSLKDIKGSKESGIRPKLLKKENFEIITKNGRQYVEYTPEEDDYGVGSVYSACVLLNDIAHNENALLDRIFKGNVYINSETPKVIQVTKEIRLSINDINTSNVQLSWLGLDDSLAIDKIEIYEASTENQLEFDYDSQKIIGGHVIRTITKGPFGIANSSVVTRPSENKYYRLLVYFTSTGNGTALKLVSNIATTGPLDYIIEPFKPQVPEPASKEVIDYIKENKEGIEKSDYLVEGDNPPIAEMLGHTFHTSSYKPLKIQLVWNAQKDKENKVAYDLTYDIWVAKDSNLLNEETPTTSLTIQDSQNENLIKNTDGEVVGFKTQLEEYTNAEGVNKKLVPNETYYIKIVAKRGDKVSLPTIVNITVDSTGDISTPPVLSKPPVRIQEGSVTKDSAVIEWSETWSEIKADDANKHVGSLPGGLSTEVIQAERQSARLWNSSVYTNNNGSVVRFTPDTNENLKKTFLLNESKANQIIQANSNYIMRTVSLGKDVKYELNVVPYDSIDLSGYTTTSSAIALWVKENGADTQGWQTISPNANQYTAEDITVDGKEFKVNGLQPNTRYVILLRAYREVEGEDGMHKLYQAFPSYAIVTTDTDYEADEAIPLVPNLYKQDVTDTSVTVWWRYNSDFDYEIVYSRLEDPNTAEKWEVKVSNDPESKNYVENGGKAIETITGLSPDTTYNFWIRAKQKKGDKQSAWSNPLTVKTNDLGAPGVPTGLGKASNQSILEAGQEFDSVTKDSITVDWNRLTADEKNKDETKVYSYILEAANNKAFADSIIVNTADPKGDGFEVFGKNLVRFTGLEANKEYFFRVKAVLTYTDPASGKVIVKESDFCQTVRIKTATSSDEYDGGDNPNIIEYEKPIIETYKNNIWTYELVDAAKITTGMLNNKQYYYTVTMEYYNGKHDATTRSIKMPVKILQTISNQGMALQVVTNIGTYEIPGEALKSYLAQYQGTDTVQFDITKMNLSDIASYNRSYPEQYQSGEKLQIIFRGDSKNTTVHTLNKNMKVKLKTDVAGSYNYTNYTPYLYNYNTGNWMPCTYQVDVEDNKYLNYSTMYTGLNALYAKSMASGNVSSNYVMNTLTNLYNIKGLGTTYKQNTPVKASQYVTLMLGIAEDGKSIDLTQAATAADYKAAKLSGIFTSDARGNITKEQALAGAVKLYEMKHGNKVKPSNMKFNNVSASYREAASKAYAIGMIDSITSPQASINYGQLCDWIAVAID